MVQMVSPQLDHNVNSLNRETSEHNTCEAQFLTEPMCDFNETFKREDNFTDFWWKTMDNNKGGFGSETEELLANKE